MEPNIKPKTKKTTKKASWDFDIKEIMKAGLHFGHKKTKGNPKMEPYIVCIRNNVHIIDPEKTAQKLREALEFLRDVKEKEGVILFVGTRPQAKNLIRELAEELKMPYITERWLGGTLTNFKVLSQRAAYYEDITKKKETGEFTKYTKKERVRLEKELQKMERKFKGITSLKKLPECLFVVDICHDDLAIKEANREGIPIVGICDTNTDPTLVTYPIPANDDAISSIKYILGKIKEALEAK